MTAEYVRAVEQHVCQKNDGHLIRVVGPAFELVCGWERDGIPLKVALRGIDRYFERYYRNGPRRRPVRVEFCDTDVLEVFDEWRRAVGVTAKVASREPGSPSDVADAAGAAGSADAVATPATGHDDAGDRHGPSLPAHLQRVLLKLSSARATGRLGASFDVLLDRVNDDLERARAQSRGLRGDARQTLIDRLTTLDRMLLDAALAALPDEDRGAMTRDADAELEGYRDRMSPEAYARAQRRLVDHLVRERLGLPVVSFA